MVRLDRVPRRRVRSCPLAWEKSGAGINYDAPPVALGVTDDLGFERSRLAGWSRSLPDACLGMAGDTLAPWPCWEGRGASGCVRTVFAIGAL
jgi:hypothetical protein